MPEYAPDAPLQAIAGRKRAGAARHQRHADELHAEADELEAEALRRAELRALADQRRDADDEVPV